jgi:hypothetical protein
MFNSEKTWILRRTRFCSVESEPSGREEGEKRKCSVFSDKCAIYCIVLPCFVLSRLVSCCLVLFCLVLSCLVLAVLVLFCLALSCLPLSRLVLSRFVSCSLVLFRLFVSCLVCSCLVLCCLVLSCLEKSLQTGEAQLKKQKKLTKTFRDGEVDSIKLRQDCVRCDDLAYLPNGFNQLPLVVFAEIIRQALHFVAVLCCGLW